MTNYKIVLQCLLNTSPASLVPILILIVIPTPDLIAIPIPVLALLLGRDTRAIVDVNIPFVVVYRAVLNLHARPTGFGVGSILGRFLVHRDAI